MRYTAPDRRVARRPVSVWPLVVVSCAVLLTAACGTDDVRPQVALSASGTPLSPEDPASAGTEPTSPLPDGQTSSTATPVTPGAASTPGLSGTPAGPVITLGYAEGVVTGDTGRIEIAVGEPVTLRVTSDVQEQIHVHGADVYLDLAPGIEAVTQFTQDAPGIYQVELHDSGGVLTRVQVE